MKTDRESLFFHTPLHSATPLGGSPSEYCHPVSYGKTRMVGLPDGEKILRICIIVYTQYRRVTDGRTNRRTSCDGIVRAVHTRRAVKTGLGLLTQQPCTQTFDLLDVCSSQPHSPICLATYQRYLALPQQGNHK